MTGSGTAFRCGLLCLLAVALCSCGGGPRGSGNTPLPGDREGPAGVPAEVLSAAPDATGGLVVRYFAGRCEELAEAAAVPEQDGVRVVLRVENTGGTCVGIEEVRETVLALDAPLGDRVVLDEDGKAVPPG